MKLLIELYRESIDIKFEINVLTAEINKPGITLDNKLTLLNEITGLHHELNCLRKEIRERARSLSPASVSMA